MSVAEGETVYSHGSPPCSGVGLAWSDEELDTALSGPVSEVLFDDEGKADIEEILLSLADTDFEQESVNRILEDPEDIEDWRVGEAIAETYLIDHRACYFPWPDGRDERKSGSSLPGADLVGFGTDSDGDCFAFGEVKTSSDTNYPPGSMYGRTGLKQQLEDLRDSEPIRDDLFIYLAHRVKASWKPRFEAASKRYLKNSSDVQLYGVLVRDVPPHADDLRVRVHDLAENCPEGTDIELLALYLPEGRIDGIGKSAVTKRKGNDI